ncbi:hypothetical protein G3M48_007926 [Beauveria asiatica]|uniref:Uncharacterized protein n=1 Tax=Beauveria asiatica TaxID=1069075 RepID=A0AAW0RL77_9HYPO
MQSQNNTSGTMVKRAASEGLPNTPKNGNEAAGAQYNVVEHATQLHALLSGLPKLDITDKDSNICGGLLDISLARPLTDKYTERGAVHCEKEHDNANVAATPEGSIIPRGILGRLRIRASTPGKRRIHPMPHKQISVESRHSSQPGDGDEESGSTTTKATSHDGELSPHVEDQQTWEIFIGLGGSVPDNNNS